jgi:hypothetical protein
VNQGLGGFLNGIREALERASVPYMLAGSMAGAAYGRIRTTDDIDIVIDPTLRSLERLLTEFPDDTYYVSKTAARGEGRSDETINVTPLDGFLKIDFIIRRDTPHGIADFARRQRIDIAGMPFDVATPEDTIIAKLAWAAAGGSARQLEDVRGIVAAQAELLDSAYLMEWVERLALDALWRQATDGVSGA